jgi:hypothetical protein
MSKQGVASMLALALLLGASILALALLLGAFAATPTGQIYTYPIVLTAGIHASRIIH